MADLWTLDLSTITGLDLGGYAVAAVDGDLGKVVSARYTPGSAHVVVSTGRFFGHDVLVPAGLIERIDVSARTLHLSPSKEEVKQLPEAGGGLDESTRSRIESVAAALPAPKR